VLAWLLVNQIANSDFEFDVKPHQGLTVSAKGIPVIRGYYSSNSKDQVIRQIDSNTVELKFDDGGASGTVTYRRSGNHLTADYDFHWNRNDPAQIELNEGLIWVPPFQNGQATIDGKSRNLPNLPPVGNLENRSLGKPATNTTLTGNAVVMTTTTDQAISTYDGRKYSQDWAEPAPVYWQGILSLPVHNGTATKVHVDFAFTAKDEVKAEPKKLLIGQSLIKNGFLPDEAIPALIPNPKMSILDWNNTLTISNLWKLPAGRPKYFDLFRAELEKRFEMPEPGTVENRVSFDGGMSEFKKRVGMYQIKITKDSISIYGQEAAGLRNGVYRLAQMAFIKNGKICLPTGIIEDEPRSDFRGVHLFVGPQAIPFQQKLWNNVLLPLGFNKVVLQCERTDWNALPGGHTPITMKQEDLVKLFSWYRSQSVEPIPLIQSFGHMDWFFANGMNKGMAYNDDLPYTLDPRKDGSKQAIAKIWDEAIQALKPKTIHVGLDEVDMLGFPTRYPPLTTELWKNMVPFLGSIAERNNVNLMMWGDEGLAPGEAVDATNGDDKDNAAQRRRAIPKGTMIADWHYKADPSHSPFLKSLQLWKNEGFQPIASTWYQPDNIRSFDLAADVENVGTLQTTWAGYDSNEANMLTNLNQFTAMVLAGDYGWSGRSEKVEELPYDAVRVFGKMYNPKQSPLVPSEALLVGVGDLFSVGGVKFSKLENTGLAGIAPASLANPHSLELTASGIQREVAVALSCELSGTQAEKIGEMTVTYKDGTQETINLLYGLHVKAFDDDGATFFGERDKGRTCFRFSVKPKELKSISFRATNRFSGLRVEGLTLIPLKGKRSPSSGRQVL
jgi:hypothetical protein